jgi:hypothetical protein
MGEYRLPASIDTLPAIVPLRPRLEATRGNFVGGGATRGKVRVSALLGEDASLQPAEFNLRRLGPHFVVTGPPLCGKTTTLYNFVLSVAARYSPEQVKFVLIDFQARFAHYGGANRLDQLPHVVASIVEAGELPGLVERLEGECKAIEADNGRRSLFVVIDNFDDLAEDTLSTRDNEVREAGNTLVRLARRYGTRGVHFLAAGAFAAPSDMGRILLASNFGIGLRTGAALDTLKVNRIPSSLRDRELGVGRGFIIKSGQATMIQVATPYQDQAVASTGSEIDARGLGGDEARGDEEDAAVAALDAWIAQLREQWQEYTPATWAQLAEGGGGAAARTGATLVLSRQVVAMQDFLRKAMLRELRNEAGEAGNGAGHELLTQRWLMLSAEAQGDESVLLGLCRDAVVQKLRADGVPQPESMVQYASSAEDLLMMAEGFLGGEDEGGEESDEFALDDAEFADELEEMFGDDEEAAED